MEELVNCVWTSGKHVTKYMPAVPMLSEADLEAAGPNCAQLHAYFMEHSKDKTGFPAKVAKKYFQVDGDLNLKIAFSDVYDLITLAALDITFMRLWTLKMMQQAAEMQVLMATSNQFSHASKAIIGAMENDYVVGAYNTGGHWVTVIICMIYKEVSYLDPARLHPPRGFKDLKLIMNWAFADHMNEVMKGKKKKPKTNPELKHKTNIACAQQPRGSILSGFLVAFNMLSLLKDIPHIKKAADFKASQKVTKEELKPIQDMMCELILKETLDPKGKFYSDPKGDAL